jgi:hypothetical protein
VNHFARLKRLPISKFGWKLAASRKQLRRAYAKMLVVGIDY